MRGLSILVNGQAKPSISSADVKKIEVNGGSGNDTISLAVAGGQQAILIPTVLNGGAGNDKITGGEAGDLIQGVDGNDVLTGNGGNDSLLGGAGNDTLIGGTGDATLDGGDNSDWLVGGVGTNQMSREDRVLLLTHELVHVRQYRDEAGKSLAKYGEKYFRGLANVGNYEDNPMEVEANGFVDANEAIILNFLATPAPVPAAWQQVGGAAKDIAAGADGSIWAIGTNPVGAGSDFGIYKRDGSTWQNQGGGGVRIAVSRDGQPWVVNSLGQIFRLV